MTGTVAGDQVAYGDTVAAGAVTAQYAVRVPDLDPDRVDVQASIDGAAGAGRRAGPAGRQRHGRLHRPTSCASTPPAPTRVRALEARGTLALEDATAAADARPRAGRAQRRAVAPGAGHDRARGDHAAAGDHRRAAPGQRRPARRRRRHGRHRRRRRVLAARRRHGRGHRRPPHPRGTGRRRRRRADARRRRSAGRATGPWPTASSRSRRGACARSTSSDSAAG